MASASNNQSGKPIDIAVSKPPSTKGHNPPHINISEWNRRGSFKVVVGIDFGTDGSGVAIALNDGSGKVFVDQDINDNSRFIDVKTKTNILLDENGAFIAFGREATEQYIRQFDNDDDGDDDDAQASNSNKWLYFSQFKMALYKKAIKKQSSMTKGGPNDAADDEKKEATPAYKTDIKKELTAANGKKLSSRIVFIEALKFMKKHALKMFTRYNIQITDESDIKWVLSVPAIWSDKAKGLMESWAIDAGLITKDSQVMNQLVLCYEPDAASASIQNEINDYKKHLQLQQNKNEEKENEQPARKRPKEYLVAGEKYLLLDLGGGTADIAAHQVIAAGDGDAVTVKEIHYPSGGAWGSGYIDRHFIRLLNDILEPGWLTEFQSLYPSEYTVLLNNFRRAKERFYAHEAQDKVKDPSAAAYSKSKSHNVTLPAELIEFIEEKLEKSRNLRQIANQKVYESASEYFEDQTFLGTPGKWILNDEKLELDYSVWASMFDEVIDQTIDHCRMLLKLDALNKDSPCRYICLVGGFSSSKYLQHRIMYELGIKSEYKLIVIVPKRPSLSVVDGAVRLGLKPDFISARKLRKTYGIKVNAPIARFTLSDLNEELVQKHRYFNKRANLEYLHCIFHPYVRCGDEIDITDKPITTQFYASKKNIVGIDVYCTDERDPTFVDGDPVARKDVPLPANWDIHQTFPISFFFGDTKIRVFADIDGLADHEKEIRLDYEF
eukprot:CAMPEP_0202692808 /NCGR_PEP_ID=MMETSP1385-20130828/7099_1 /ASSEMBLY_ACC=CAM_ASM_000861 /TAXON_ID=933848 /ORGANISM="Elphidium margaritaceum" /LENGTH=722 /DNA_ID=CAMNT_0049348405 /DNA_START=35 /DNA_END=2203 /DNA_ORIENTATION=+